MNFAEELKWRGMVHDMIPGTEEYLKQGMATACLLYTSPSPRDH